MHEKTETNMGAFKLIRTLGAVCKLVSVKGIYLTVGIKSRKVFMFLYLTQFTLYRFLFMFSFELD